MAEERAGPVLGRESQPDLHVDQCPQSLRRLLQVKFSSLLRIGTG